MTTAGSTPESTPPWLTEKVKNMLLATAHGQDKAPILADALEEDGYDDAKVLGDLRSDSSRLVHLALIRLTYLEKADAVIHLHEVAAEHEVTYDELLRHMDEWAGLEAEGADYDWDSYIVTRGFDNPSVDREKLWAAYNTVRESNMPLTIRTQFTCSC